VFYFETFNSDTSIRKVISGLDDKVMANQFIAGRFDAMIVLDPEAIEKAMKDINFTDYSYANYRYVPKSATTMACRRKAFGLGSKRLNTALLDLLKSGRVKQIYRKYNVPPPVE
jgi:polar amino acid transport system substrate-binding protein